MIVPEVRTIVMRDKRRLSCAWEERESVTGQSIVEFVSTGKCSRGRVYPYTVNHIKGVATLDDGTKVEGVRPAPARLIDLVAVKKVYRKAMENRHTVAYEAIPGQHAF